MEAELVAELSDLTPDDGSNDEAVLSLIRSTLARATRLAPCVADTTIADGTKAALRGVLGDVIRRRWTVRKAPVTPGVTTTKTIGNRSYSVNGGSGASVLFQPDDIAELQAICTSASTTALAATTPVWSFPPARPWPC